MTDTAHPDAQHQHQHDDHLHPGPTGQDPAVHWEEFYTARETVWSGRANPLTVAEVADLTPGRVLDLGCGEGGDALWFAGRGWQVTAVDVADTALRRVVEQALAAGVGEAVRTERHDLNRSLPEGSWDLVSTAFLHSWPDVPLPADLHRRAASLVAPGGHLVIVGHAGWASWQDEQQHEHDHPGVHFDTVEEVLAQATAAPGKWEVLRAERVSAESTGPDGQPGTRTDQVVHLRRTDGAG